MEKKEEYLKVKESELEKWAATIELWRARAESAAVEAQADYELLLRDLKVKEAEARRKLAELKDSSGQAWQELTGGVDGAVDELGSALDRAAEKFS